jgi:hypothetical protein
LTSRRASKKSVGSICSSAFGFVSHHARVVCRVSCVVCHRVCRVCRVTDPKFLSPEKEGEMWRRVGNEQWSSNWFLLKDGSLYIFRRKSVSNPKHRELIIIYFFLLLLLLIYLIICYFA